MTGKEVLSTDLLDGEAKRQRMIDNSVIDVSVTQDDGKSPELKEQLLPGIPDELTLDLITPKLGWKTFLALSSTCSSWRKAIQDHLVYDARVRTHSTETLVLVQTWPDDEGYGYFLYSFREKTSYRLPPLCREDGSPTEGSCIGLDGRIYVLGGIKYGNIEHDELYSTDKVWVLDLAGQRPWKQCASMQNTREQFGCGAMDGKIYVFGGFTSDILNGGTLINWIPSCSYVKESEVYDPSVDAWSAIKHMPGGSRSHSVVTTAGEELLVHGGYKYESSDCSFKPANDFMAYSPATGNWRLLSENVGLDRIEDDTDIGLTMFLAHGKVHCMSLSTIDVYDSERDSWTQLHSFLLEGEDEGVYEVKPVDNELLAILSSDKCLVQSKGFGSGEKEIVWERVPCPPFTSRLISTITL